MHVLVKKSILCINGQSWWDVGIGGNGGVKRKGTRGEQ